MHGLKKKKHFLFTCRNEKLNLAEHILKKYNAGIRNGMIQIFCESVFQMFQNKCYLKKKPRWGTKPNGRRRHYPDICEALVCHKLSEAMNPEIKVKQIDCLVGPCQTEVSV